MIKGLCVAFFPSSRSGGSRTTIASPSAAKAVVCGSPAELMELLWLLRANLLGHSTHSCCTRTMFRNPATRWLTCVGSDASRKVFSAGASHYGVADLQLLAAETHKFESRYLDGLVRSSSLLPALWAVKWLINECSSTRSQNLSNIS